MPRKRKEKSNNYFNPFPTALRKIMEESGTTQDELADFLGVTRQSISCYCGGDTSPTIETLVKIANYFDVSTDYLLGINPDPARLPSAANELGLKQENIELLSLAQKVVNEYRHVKSVDVDELSKNAKRLFLIMSQSGFMERYYSQSFDDKLTIDRCIDLFYRYEASLRKYTDAMISAVLQNGGILLDFENYEDIRNIETNKEADIWSIAGAELVGGGRVHALTNSEYIRYTSNEIAKAIDRYLVERHTHGKH